MLSLFIFRFHFGNLCNFIYSLSDHYSWISLEKGWNIPKYWQYSMSLIPGNFWNRRFLISKYIVFQAGESWAAGGMDCRILIICLFKFFIVFDLSLCLSCGTRTVTSETDDHKHHQVHILLIAIVKLIPKEENQIKNRFPNLKFNEFIDVHQEGGMATNLVYRGLWIKPELGNPARNIMRWFMLT